MKTFALTVMLACVPATLAQDKPSAEPINKPAEAAAPAAAPKADEPAALNRIEKDGLIIEDLVMGGGAEVKPGAVVLAHYRGTLKEGGAEFDSSYKRGEPAMFPLKGLIKGWQDGIPGMKIGGKRRLTIPWAMAYGEQGRPPVIPAKADLVFEIEIVDALISEDIKVGDGAAFAAGSVPSVTVKYTIRKVGGDVISQGTTAAKPEGNAVAQANSGGAGEVMCKSDDKGEACDFRLLIPAMQMGMDGMKVNGVRKLTFPASMGWQQKPSPIAAGAKLECQVELVSLPEVAAATPMPSGK